MTCLQKLRKPQFFKCASLLCAEISLAPSKSHLYVYGLSHILQLHGFCTAERAVNSKSSGSLCELAKRSRVVRKKAQAALLDYLHSTRSLQFLDAENMSKNTPKFLDRLLKRVDTDDGDVGRSLTRFLRYHPFNEFEPFFESIGLDPSEYSSFLPRNLMFLSDDQLLLQNYYVLCNYGIPRNRIGKIYKEAMEVFSCDYGVLQQKLLSFHNLGLKQSLVVKIIASSPYLLKEDVDINRKLLDFLGKLKNVGIEYSWLEEHITGGDSHNWKCLFELMCLLCELGFTDEKVGEIITNHPDFLLSGRVTYCLFGFLFKFGSKTSDVKTLLLEFPNTSILKFTNNLCNCYKFLAEIKMPAEDIGMMVRSYPLLLGSCELKKVKSLLCMLNCGMTRLCQMIKDDPYVLKKWVRGTRVDRLAEPNRVLKVRMLKTQFLLNLGFVEKSEEMERALKVFRGKGVELQERFDCLVNMGLTWDEAIAMVKVAPQILNQSKDVITEKIDFFVKDLGYPVSDVVKHPALVSYTVQRVKLRLLTYKWLRDEGMVHPNLALSTLLSCSEEIFVRCYVNSHPRGPQFWERMKMEIYPK